MWSHVKPSFCGLLYPFEIKVIKIKVCTDVVMRMYRHCPYMYRHWCTDIDLLCTDMVVYRHGRTPCVVTTHAASIAGAQPRFRSWGGPCQEKRNVWVGWLLNIGGSYNFRRRGLKLSSKFQTAVSGERSSHRRRFVDAEGNDEPPSSSKTVYSPQKFFQCNTPKLKFQRNNANSPTLLLQVNKCRHLGFDKLYRK